MLQIINHSVFNAAASVGNWPRLRIALRSPLPSGDNCFISRITYVEIDGTTYTVSGFTPEDFTRMVQAQAEKIRQR